MARLAFPKMNNHDPRVARRRIAQMNERRQRHREKHIASVNAFKLKEGKVYSFSEKCSDTCICCPEYIGKFIEVQNNYYGLFKLVYPSSGIKNVSLSSERFTCNEAEPPLSPTLAKQYARGLCEYIPEDCAGIIERFLTCMAGHGPFRYPMRAIDSN
jgi:hypothetical protein